jgi:hypothetical protein
MPSYANPDPETLQLEIKDFYACYRQLGVNPGETRNPRQKSLTPEELEYRLRFTDFSSDNRQIPTWRDSTGKPREAGLRVYL